MTQKYKSFMAFHQLIMKKGEMPNPGLCGFIQHQSSNMKEIFELVTPTSDDLDKLEHRGNKSAKFWGSESESMEAFKLTPLRETILLLCAAINNEL